MKYALLVLSFFLTAMKLPDKFSCSGTEPFWGVSSKSGKLEWTSIDEKPKLVSAIDVRTFSGMSVGAGLTVRGKWEKKKVSLHFIRGPECSDGMSERKYEGYGVFDTGREVYYGCCLPIPGSDQPKK